MRLEALRKTFGDALRRAGDNPWLLLLIAMLVWGANAPVIRAAVLAGVRRGEAEVREVGDRRAAIRAAVRRAGPGDIVLIAGKGHETGQEVGGQVLPFDDRVVAAEELVAR